MKVSEYYNEKIIIDFEIPGYLTENINNLIKERKDPKSLKVDLEEDELLSNINRAIYDRYITEEQAMFRILNTFE